MPASLNTELFLIGDGAAYLVYAPLRNCLMRVGPKQVNILARLKAGQSQPEDLDTEFFKGLVRAGILDGPPEVRPPTCIGQPYAPKQTSLLLTTRCNLACKYCYADAGKTNLVMDEKIGRAAVDYVAGNCKQRGATTLAVSFHGGGEPTMAWEELVALGTYAEEVAQKCGLKIHLGLATNGCFSEAKARWLAAHIPFVNISLDGPPRIQNTMRPLKDGGDSWPLIRRTLKVFDECKTPYAFQATVTRENVPEMPAIVRFVAGHTRCRVLKFEAVSECGRFSGQRDRVPFGLQFAQSFNQSVQVAQERGLRVTFAGLRLSGRPLSFFCEAFGEPFSVTPEGCVSACFETFCCNSSHSELYLFGQWDEGTGEFQIDRDKLERLRQRNVYNLNPCSKCFCKYSCAGDCATRNHRHFNDSDLFKVGARCEAIREITRGQLSRIVGRAASVSTPTSIPQLKANEDVSCQ